MPLLQLKGGYTANDTRLGRFPEFDDRSRNFPVARKLPTGPSVPEVTRKTWYLRQRLSQRNTPKCVAYAFTHEYAAEPQTHHVTEAMADEWYPIAQANDEWPGDQYDGTSTLGGAKAGVILKRFEQYLWCFSLEDVINTILYLGPVLTGTNWYRRMFDPDDRGFIVPDGPLDGGHEWLMRGVHVPHEYFIMTNTWARSWGKNGDAKISFSDYDRLRKEDGDAVHIVHPQR